MTRLVPRLALVALSCAGILVGQRPVARASIQDRGPFVVGEPVHVSVLVLAPNYFTGAPQFPELNIDNAIVLLPDETPQHSNESIDGETYAGIARTYVVYPQQPGRFQLPAAQITVPYAAKPPQSVQALVSLPRISFEAAIPQAAEGLDYFLPTISLSIHQQFDRPLRDLKVGDSIKRTVTVTASRLKAMFLPPARLEAPGEVSMYVRQPIVTDIKTDRGEFVEGRRVDSAVYLFRKPGSVKLPEISVDWWDIGAHKVRMAALAPIELTVLPAPIAGQDLAPEPEASSLPAPSKGRIPPAHFAPAAEFVGGIMLLTAISWFGMRNWPRLRDRWRHSRELRRLSEPVLFAHLRKACRRGEAQTAYVLFVNWLHRFCPGCTVDEFTARSADAALKNELAHLGQLLYRQGSGSPWSGRLLISRVEIVRRLETKQLRRNIPLPALNPERF